jgi:hypothetical protein
MDARAGRGSARRTFRQIGQKAREMNFKMQLVVTRIRTCLLLGAMGVCGHEGNRYIRASVRRRIQLLRRRNSGGDSQCKTLQEAKANLIDALKLVLQCQRELAAGEVSPDAIREQIELSRHEAPGFGAPFARIVSVGGLVNFSLGTWAGGKHIIRIADMKTFETEVEIGPGGLLVLRELPFAAGERVAVTVASPETFEKMREYAENMAEFSGEFAEGAGDHAAERLLRETEW